MREHHRGRKHVGGLPGSNIEQTSPWMKNARAYKREPSVHEGFEVIIGYAEFNGLRGTEAHALEAAMKEVNPSQRVHEHHQRVYSFVHVPTEEAVKVERKLRAWKYSPHNQIDLLRRSLDLPEQVEPTRRSSRKTRRLQQREALFR